MYSLILLTVIQTGPIQIGEAGQNLRPPVHRDQNPEARKQDMVLRWNELTLDAIRKERTPPPVAARNLAIVHASIFDAVNEINPALCRKC